MIILLRPGLVINRDLEVIYELPGVYDDGNIFVNNKLFYQSLNSPNYWTWLGYKNIRYLFKVPRLLKKGDVITSGFGLFKVRKPKNGSDKIRVLKQLLEIDLSNGDYKSIESTIELGFKSKINRIVIPHIINFNAKNTLLRIMRIDIFSLNKQFNLFEDYLGYDVLNQQAQGPVVFDFNNLLIYQTLRVQVGYKVINTTIGVVNLAIIFELEQIWKHFLKDK